MSDRHPLERTTLGRPGSLTLTTLLARFFGKIFVFLVLPLHPATPDLMSGGRLVSPMTRTPNRRRSSVPSMGRVGNGPQSSSPWCSTRRSHSGSSQGESAGISRTRSRADCTVSWKVSMTSIVRVFKVFFFRLHLITGLSRGPPRSRGESSPDLLMTLVFIVPRDARKIKAGQGFEKVTSLPLRQRTCTDY